jgi:hypothetical protein
MTLTTREYDALTEIQYNLDVLELDEAISQLRPEALIALRDQCVDCIDRQRDILARVQNRLAQN